MRPVVPIEALSIVCQHFRIRLPSAIDRLYLALRSCTPRCLPMSHEEKDSYADDKEKGTGVYTTHVPIDESDPRYHFDPHDLGASYFRHRRPRSSSYRPGTASAQATPCPNVSICMYVSSRAHLSSRIAVRTSTELTCAHTNIAIDCGHHWNRSLSRFR